MKIFMAIVFLVPLLGFGQSKGDGFFGASVGAEQVSGQNGITGSFIFGSPVNPTFFAGVGCGVSKLAERRPIVPLFMHLNFVGKTKLAPVFIFQPGYGIYKEAAASGGFHFYGGGGIGIKSSNAIAQFTVGYSYYSFHSNGAGSAVDGVGIRFTLMGI